ncbi:UPF0149 family protein [Thiofilum flexile]|uniref:UPF0149 family protein n=1 Tax=Thiofilum flexile TaxID=125627 RepID=UPI00035DE33C|nr:UPF0149 family protein [Thiofilum flexile]
MDKQTLINALSRFGQPDLDPAQRNTNFSTLRLTSADAPLLLDIISQGEEFYAQESTWFVPLYAWRALKSLGTPIDISELLAVFEFYQDNDWAMDELPGVIAAAGERALAPTFAYIRDEGRDEFLRSWATEILPAIGTENPNLRQTIVDQLTELLAQQGADTAELNAFIVSALVELKALESLVVINKAYAEGKVVEAIVGDFEDVEIELGLKTERTNPRLYSSLLPDEEGIEPPSQEPVPDDISNDDVFDRLQQHLDYYGHEYSIQEVAGLDGLFAAVACAPKMIMPTEWLAAIWGGEEYMPEFPSQAELTIFIELIMKLFNQTYQHLKETKKFQASFMSSVDEDGTQILNVQSWCDGFMRGIVLGQPPLIEAPEMQKMLTPIAIFGTPQGYAKVEDMSDDEIQNWAAQIEPTVLQIRDWALAHAPKLPPIVNPNKVGRNDPCPCGSGLKYKKCCGA